MTTIDFTWEPWRSVNENILVFLRAWVGTFSVERLREIMEYCQCCEVGAFWDQVSRMAGWEILERLNKKTLEGNHD